MVRQIEPNVLSPVSGQQNLFWYARAWAASCGLKKDDLENCNRWLFLYCLYSQYSISEKLLSSEKRISSLFGLHIAVSLLRSSPRFSTMEHFLHWSYMKCVRMDLGKFLLSKYCKRLQQSNMFVVCHFRWSKCELGTGCIWFDLLTTERFEKQ